MMLIVLLLSFPAENHLQQSRAEQQIEPELVVQLKMILLGRRGPLTAVRQPVKQLQSIMQQERDCNQAGE